MRTLRLLVLPADYFDFAWAGLTTVCPAVQAMDAEQALSLLETLPDDSVAASSSEDEFVEPDNPVENIYSDNDRDDDMASESSASKSAMDVTDDDSVAEMSATNGGRGRGRERKFGLGIGRRHGRGRGVQVLCIASGATCTSQYLQYLGQCWHRCDW